jgi:hypothetical protein
MKRMAVLFAALGALVQPALAESTWERLEHGIDVVRECSGDIRQLCKGTKPGDGRIKACVAKNFGNLSGACVKAIAEPEPAVLADGLNATPKRIENSHLMRFIEMYLAGIDPATGDVVGQCYGSYAMPNVPANKDTAPQAEVAALNMNRLRRQYGVLAASLNGPKIWIPDWFDIEEGKTRQFGALAMPWTAQVNLGKKLDVNNVNPYEPVTIKRKSAINWNKGRVVMVLDDPQGNTWIMKGFELGLKPKITYEAFLAAGPANFKTLPPGWKARVVTLEKDNLEIPEGGVATIMVDEFFNVYDKTGPGMSNSKP